MTQRARSVDTMQQQSCHSLHRHCQVQPTAHIRPRQQSQQHCRHSLQPCKAAQQHLADTCETVPSTPSRRSVLASTAALLSCFSSQALWGQQPAQAYLVDETAAQSVFALAARSVVSINDYKVQGGGELLEGIGTGFVWDQYGHIVTNYHVVSKYVLNKGGSQSVKVVLGEGSSSDGSSNGSSTYQARLVGTDALHDLAVLEIDAPKEALVPIRVGTSGDLKVGQSVYAIGNPSGLSKTLTAGVVSGLNRTIPAPTGTRIYGAIQTDANINAGNSGGPLLDSFGRLVGINTASFTRSGSGRGSGVNFALPADMVRTTVPNLIIYGTAAGKGVRGSSRE